VEFHNHLQSTLQKVTQIILVIPLKNATIYVIQITPTRKQKKDKVNMQAGEDYSLRKFCHFDRQRNAKRPNVDKQYSAPAIWTKIWSILITA
jgi:hypothetical protein